MKELLRKFKFSWETQLAFRPKFVECQKASSVRGKKFGQVSSKIYKSQLCLL